MRRHPLQQRRGRHIRSDAVGYVCAEIGWRRAVFGVGAVSLRGNHPIADPERGHIVADGLDRPADFDADDERQLPFVHARSEIGVDEVDADGLGLDQHLTGSGGGGGLVDVLQDLGSAGFGDLNGLHGVYHRKVMKLARPDIRHPRIVLAGCPALPEGDGDDAELVDVLRQRGLAARWLSWDDPQALRRRPCHPPGDLGLHRPP